MRAAASFLSGAEKVLATVDDLLVQQDPVTCDAYAAFLGSVEAAEGATAVEALVPVTL